MTGIIILARANVGNLENLTEELLDIGQLVLKRRNKVSSFQGHKNSLGLIAYG